ncbi:unnamed protein product [[Candida] boidinii]|nr:unnamed protein product [[Candida] boidinii]
MKKSTSNLSFGNISSDDEDELNGGSKEKLPVVQSYSCYGFDKGTNKVWGCGKVFVNENEWISHLKVSKDTACKVPKVIIDST